MFGPSDLTLPSGKDEKNTSISELGAFEIVRVLSRLRPAGDDRMITEAPKYSLRHQGFIKMIKYEKNTKNI